MNLVKRYFLVAAIGLCVFAGASVAANAQETPMPAATTAPLPEHPTPMDRAYDGKVHVTLAPYIFLPTLRTNTQFTVPTLPQRVGGAIQNSVQVGPTDYLTNINAAAMFAFGVRMGTVELLGDYIYTNASVNTSFATSIGGPLGHVSIPVTFNTSSRTAAKIWELAAGTTLAHGHDADLNLIAGWRQFPINVTLGYNAVVGKSGLIAPSGTVVQKLLINDVVFGLQGKAFFGSDHFYVPYYIDLGAGANNQTWEGYTGAGYAFDHGQSLLFTWRSLNYYGFAASSPIQKFSMHGPLLGYTFGI